MTIGIILAGGKSRRFGEDKALFRENKHEQTWAEKAAGKMSVFVSRIYVASNARNYHALTQLFMEESKVEVLQDQPPYLDKGPLGGLYAVSSLCQPTCDYLIMSVDYPLLAPSVLEKLVAVPSGYAVDADGNPHYTIAHYAFSNSEVKQQLRKGDLRLQNFIARKKIVPLPFDRQQVLINFNTKEEIMNCNGQK